MAIDIRTITSKNWQHKHNTIGDVVIDKDDVKQCIRTIATTQKGSVPFASEFGCDLISGIGENPQETIANLKIIYLKEIPKQEPRCEIIDITGTFDDNGRVQMEIYYKLKNSDSAEKVEIYV